MGIISVKHSLKKISLLTVGFIFLVTGIIAPFSVQSQDVTPLSLKETIEMSLKNSPALKASSARSEQASFRVRQALDNRLPDINVSGSYLQIANPTISAKSNLFGGGGDSSGRKSEIPHVNQAMYGILNVALPIYAGGKIRYGIQSAKFLEQAADLDVEKDKESVILNTINAYVNLYKAGVTVDVFKDNLAQSEHRDSVFSRLEQNGLLARNDLLKSELQTSNIELTLLDAQNNLKIANVNMDLMIGMPEATVIHTDAMGFDKDFAVKTIDDYEQIALKNRKDIRALSFRKKAATTGIAIANADQYPTIALTGGYIAADIPHLIRITNAVNVGIGFKYNLSFWKSKSQISEARSKEKELIADEVQMADGVRLHVNQDFENFLLSQRKIEVYNKAVTQAEENYRITKNKYDNALVNTTDLLEANVSLLQSKINLAVAKADVLLAYSRLLETSGIIEQIIK
ncbi:MAG: TolC family protein [Ginsengibacter sp.]